MATNVSEKDKTLNEIIDWCENQRRKILADIEPAPGEDAEEAYADLESVIRSDNPIIKYSNDLLDGSEAFVYGVIMQARLLDHIIDHCRSMLGYSGNMPSEVPNQSEDAKNEMETGLVGHRRKPADRTDGGGCGRNIHCLLRLHMGRSDNRQNHHHARRKSIIRLHGQRHKPGPT